MTIVVAWWLEIWWCVLPYAYQSDQMVWSFGQYLAKDYDENLPNTIIFWWNTKYAVKMIEF